jgi:hypothetical protein
VAACQRNAGFGTSGTYGPGKAAMPSAKSNRTPCRRHSGRRGIQTFLPLSDGDQTVSLWGALPDVPKIHLSSGFSSSGHRKVF